MSKITEKDISDLKSAIEVLTRAELETFAVDRCIRGDVCGALMTEEQQDQYQQDLREIPVSVEEQMEMNRVMEIVKPYLEF